MICDNHLDIEIYADRIINTVSEIQEYIIHSTDISAESFGTITEKLSKIYSAAKHSKQCAKNAMRQGQRMEKRMLRYRRAIQGLGFERKEKI